MNIVSRVSSDIRHETRTKDVHISFSFLGHDVWDTNTYPPNRQTRPKDLYDVYYILYFYQMKSRFIVRNCYNRESSVPSVLLRPILAAKNKMLLGVLI